MTSLGDFIGRLAAEVANGRAQADLEAARLAELYRTHPLLSDMPVPRFRLPTVELSVPVVVDTVPAAPAAGTLEEAKTAVQNAMMAELARRNVTLSDDERKAITARLDASARALVGDRRVQSSGLLLADALVNAASAALPSYKAQGDPTLADDLRDAARLAVVTLRNPPSQLQVKVTAAELAAANPNTVLRVNLNMSEEGLEWFGTGETPDRLRPE